MNYENNTRILQKQLPHIYKDPDMTLLYNGNVLYQIDLYEFGGFVVTPYWENNEDPNYNNFKLFMDHKADVLKFEEMFKSEQAVFLLEGIEKKLFLHEAANLLRQYLPHEF